MKILNDCYVHYNKIYNINNQNQPNNQTTKQPNNQPTKQPTNNDESCTLHELCKNCDLQCGYFVVDTSVFNTVTKFLTLIRRNGVSQHSDNVKKIADKNGWKVSCDVEGNWKCEIVDGGINFAIILKNDM